MYTLQNTLNATLALAILAMTSLPTRAAPGCGVFDPALSICVFSSREPIVKVITFVFFLCVCISLTVNRDLADRGLLARSSK